MTTQSLKKLISKKPVNVSKLARIIGLSPSYTHEIINGKKNNPESVKKVKDGINTYFK